MNRTRSDTSLSYTGYTKLSEQAKKETFFHVPLLLEMAALKVEEDAEVEVSAAIASLDASECDNSRRPDSLSRIGLKIERPVQAAGCRALERELASAQTVFWAARLAKEQAKDTRPSGEQSCGDLCTGLWPACVGFEISSGGACKIYGADLPTSSANVPSLQDPPLWAEGACPGYKIVGRCVAPAPPSEVRQHCLLHRVTRGRDPNDDTDAQPPHPPPPCSPCTGSKKRPVGVHMRNVTFLDGPRTVGKWALPSD